MFREFREFAMRGPVVDLAVGVVIGAAFGAVIASLVNDIIMPPIGYLLSGIDFSDLFMVISGGSYASLAAAKEAGAVTVNYGVFLNAIVNFLIVAFVIFLVVRCLNRCKKAAEAAPAAPPAPSRSEELLTEIRDLLKSR